MEIHKDRSRGVARLADRVALVIGAGSIGPGWGNGKATAVQFAREGAKVIAVDINAAAAQETAALIEAEGGRCTAVAADVLDERDLDRIVAEALELHGRIDILQNNVGGPKIGGPVELSADDWQRSMELNVGYMFHLCKRVLPIMAKQQSGAIVNISSIAGIRWGGVPWIGYASFKAAVHQFTQSIAMQYARQGIRANVVLAGRMFTPVVSAELGPMFGSDQELQDRIGATCPTGKMGDAWDVAYASAFLASDEARYITGAVLPVDGGVSVATTMIA